MKDLSLSDYAEIASAAHKGQFRRDGKTPYITHVRRVAESFLLEEKVEAQKVAWLHDAIEDGGMTAQELEDRGVPYDILYKVKLLTHDLDSNYTAYIRHLCIYPTTRLVKIADILDNLTDNPTPRQVKKYLAALRILTQEHL